MKKIISLFQRNYDGDRLVRNEVVPGAEWVLNGEGSATIKWDGTCCMIRHNTLYKRYDAKNGKTPPEGFIPSQDPDPVTGHWPGWVLVGESPEDKYHREAFKKRHSYLDGTYELVGPKINGNRSKFYDHVLVKHGVAAAENVPEIITFDSVRSWLENYDIEGIVWHNPDGRMVKIKRKDFGFKW
jgi:hypothetical protein